MLSGGSKHMEVHAQQCSTRTAQRSAAQQSSTAARPGPDSSLPHSPVYPPRRSRCSMSAPSRTSSSSAGTCGGAGIVKIRYCIVRQLSAAGKIAPAGCRCTTLHPCPHADRFAALSPYPPGRAWRHSAAACAPGSPSHSNRASGPPVQQAAGKWEQSGRSRLCRSCVGALQ